MVNGSMTRHTVTEYMFMPMVPNTRGIGRMTNNMVRAVKHGLMAVTMKDSINME
jgi:hypothetical protein